MLTLRGTKTSQLVCSRYLVTNQSSGHNDTYCKYTDICATSAVTKETVQNLTGQIKGRTSLQDSCWDISQRHECLGSAEGEVIELSEWFVSTLWATWTSVAYMCSYGNPYSICGCIYCNYGPGPWLNNTHIHPRNHHNTSMKGCLLLLITFFIT